MSTRINTCVEKWIGGTLGMFQCCENTKGHLAPQRLASLLLPSPPPTQTHCGRQESPQKQPFFTPHAQSSSTIWDCLPLMCYSRFGFCGVSHLWMGFYTASQRTSSTPSWLKVVGPQEGTGWPALMICRASPFHHLQALLFLLLEWKATTINRVNIKVRASDTLGPEMRSCWHCDLRLLASRTLKQ